MNPRPQLSLCAPAGSNTALLQEFAENISQFFQKTPLQYEVLFAVNPSQDESLPLLHQLATKNPRFRIVENQKNLGRAQNLQKLFSEAQGDVLIATDLDLSTPLSEVYKLLEVFYSDRETEVVFGDRFKAKRSSQGEKYLGDGVENFFLGVIKEKSPWNFADLFCPIVGIRRTSFEKIQQDLKSSGWHWTHEVQRVVQAKGLKAQEIPLFVGQPRSPQAPRSEAWHLLRFVLFRI